ncbi:cytochrome P450 [Erythrobacter sp. WG]|uniref:cytochrome P450 n=1 Tax=Erythrobacter sp. WG TaxID=2985510 RepID=UPI00226DD43E|nr:cytochrome P450 [Erythrobacter sp. WG]MCX9147163.1 cytochrome P450 [Erythrobacter sp. WG]
MPPDLDRDPFAEPRRRDGVLLADFEGEPISMILGHRAVREAAKAWQTYSSDAPFRVPIPAETGVRSVRQLPIEADPPLHKTVRDQLKPIFLKPAAPDYAARIEALVGRLLAPLLDAREIEMVRGFALPLQSIALTHLLGMPETEAEEWIAWGTHVFHDGADGGAKGAVLADYIRRRIDAARRNPGADLFGAMTRMTIEGRPLTDDEMAGIANLAFAGGRDTVINAVAAVIAHFAQDRPALDLLRGEPRRLPAAVEEFIRVTAPLTHIGRVCPHGAQIGPYRVAAGGRVSLCWASANFDDTVFDAPTELRLDRNPNPHLGFGSGPHSCLGAAQARSILRALIRQLAERTAAIDLVAQERSEEHFGPITRTAGFRSLHVRLHAR